MIQAPGRRRSLAPHVVWGILIGAGAIGTFDPARPMYGLSFWLMLLLIWTPFTIAAYVRMHRSVVLDRATRQVVITGRPWLFREVTRRYDVGALTGVRSFIHRWNSKHWTNHLELVAPDTQRGLLILTRGTGPSGADHPEIAALRARLAEETWLRDLGYVGKTDRMPRRVMALDG